MPHDQKIVTICAGTAHCMTYVNKNSEWYQLIHQAATHDLNHGIFLVGDKDAQIILGVWIYFLQELIDCYCKCMDDIHDLCFKFTEKALEGIANPESYISEKDKNRISAAIEKQTKVDYNTYIYNFKMWVAMRTLELPILSSSKCKPLLPSLWNTCKSSSDVATGMIRRLWYSLPMPARTPQALVV